MILTKLRKVLTEKQKKSISNYHIKVASIIEKERWDNFLWPTKLNEFIDKDKDDLDYFHIPCTTEKVLPLELEPYDDKIMTFDQIHRYFNEG